MYLFFVRSDKYLITSLKSYLKMPPQFSSEIVVDGTMLVAMSIFLGKE